MFLERGFVFTHEAVREWEAKLAPLFAEQLRQRRQDVVGESWYADETYVKVDGRWCYLYRAIDRNGHLVDVRLSEVLAGEKDSSEGTNVECHEKDAETKHGRRVCPRRPVISSTSRPMPPG